MRKISFVLATMMSVSCLFAADGVVLINQSTVQSAGGFPYKITQSGSYRLTGNLTVPDANTTAILVTANDVTLDLNGFGIIGPTVCAPNGGLPPTSCAPTGNGFGVSAEGQINFSVSNGFVRGMGNYGVFAGDGFVRNVRAISNGFIGIFAYNVSDSKANFNGQIGIVGGNGVVSGNEATQNVGIGISVVCPSAVVGNTSQGNGGKNLVFNVPTCAAANNAAP